MFGMTTALLANGRQQSLSPAQRRNHAPDPRKWRYTPVPLAPGPFELFRLHNPANIGTPYPE